MILKKGLGIRFGSYVEGSTAIDRSNTLSISANYTFPINIFQLYIYIYIHLRIRCKLYKYCDDSRVSF